MPRIFSLFIAAVAITGASWAQSPTPPTASPPEAPSEAQAPIVPATIPAPAIADTPPVEAPAPIVTEKLTIAGANGGFLEEGAAAGGYSFLTRTTASTTDLFTQRKTQVTVDYRLIGGGLSAPMTGKCVLRVEGRSFLGLEWDSQVTQMYTCTVAGQSEATTAMEVQLPAFKEAAFSFGGLSIGGGGDDPSQHKLLRAKMLYDGKTYEALPTGFSPPGFLGRRMVDGFSITRDGQSVGAIAFDKRNHERGVITAPVADADGRQAVLFMAFNLLKLPDFFVDDVRDMFLNRE